MSAEAVLPLVRAIGIESPLAFRFAGERVERPAATPAEAAAEARGSVLLPLLTETLYARGYARPFGAPPAPAPAPGADDDLVPVLSAANPGREGWEPRWKVRQALSSGRLVAERYGRERFLSPGEFLAAEAPGHLPRAGSWVTLWRPRDSATLQPGFYFVFGEAAWEEGAAMLRVYWNVSADGAPALTAAVAGALNRWGVPFRFKCLSRRSLYPRTDSAVLYVARRAWPLVGELLAEAQGALAGVMGEETPLFARPLGRGIALAEDPGTGESFGMHRCRLVAEGVWTAWREGRSGEEERMESVAAAFRRAGIALERPWLSPGSTARYEALGG